MDEEPKGLDELEDLAQAVADKIRQAADSYRGMKYQWAWSRFTKSVHVNREMKLWRAINAFYEEYKAMMERDVSLEEVDKFIRLCFEPSDEDKDDFAIAKLLVENAVRLANEEEV